MSGGWFNSIDSKLELHADRLEELLHMAFASKGEEEPYDFLEDATPEQRALALAEAKRLVSDMRTLAKRCKDLDYFLSGDTGLETYLEHIRDNATS